MPDLRWFSPNRYGTLPVPALRRAGVSIALSGNQPCRAVVAIDVQAAVPAFRFASRHRCPLALNIFDLPPWRLGRGRPDPVFSFGGHIVRIPRPWGRYPERPGYYSRIRFVARRARQVWCPSTHSAQDIARHFGLTPARIPFCYDSDRLLPGESPTSDAGAPPVILAISRLVPHKNHEVILRAAARLAATPLVRIIGQGPEAAALRSQADRLGVRLELQTGWASDQEIVDAYRRASVVVSASRFEGFGLTPMEGLAMGLPVLASDIPTHREFLGEAVRFFPADDDAALARGLEEALRHPRRSPGRPAVLDALTIEACADRLLPAIGRLLSA